MRPSIALPAALAAVLAATAWPAETPTPADEQLAWVISALNADGPPPTDVLRRHFTAAFLKAVPPAKVVEVFQSTQSERPFRLERAVDRRDAQTLVARIAARSGTEIEVTIHVEGAGTHLIDGLLLRPVAPPVTSWRGIDKLLRRTASSAMLYAGTADGTRIHALDATRAGAIGSAFKLYVLGALADAVKAGTAGWTEELAIHDRWKSLPSGAMRDEPAGKRFTLRHYAEQMISVSDNTATDHLIHRLGRAAVEAQLHALGNSVPARNEPFLTTRELFALKLTAPPSLREEFSRAGSEERRRLLGQVDALGLEGAMTASWPGPIDVGTIEWFASPRDLARAVASLATGSEAVRSILAINPGVTLDRATWPYAGYKGGSEPGVVSLTWYLVRHDGKAFVLSIVLDDPRRSVDEGAAVAAAEAAIGLLAKAG